METIHYVTNNHPIITILIIGLIVGIAVIVVALKNAKELNEEELKIYEQELKKLKR